MSPLPQLFDVAVIGAGVTGCAIARLLSRYDLRVLLIDAECDVAMGASRANSAIVHAGFDCAPGSLMAELNVRGNALFEGWCKELDAPFQRIGSLVVAFGEDQEPSLRDLLARGEANGVPGLRLVSGDEARSIEPLLSPAATLALLAPTAAITCPYEFTIACAENARDNGCEWLLGAPVTAMSVPSPDRVRVTAGGREIDARFVVNAAGVHADEIARLLGDDSFELFARKGEYLLFDRTAPRPRTVVFQTPSKLGKGVVVAPTVDGNSYVGPTAVNQDDRDDTSVSAESIAALQRLGRVSVPALDFRKVITNFAGIRPQPKGAHDFIIRQSEACPRLVHAAGIGSPALPSAPAIAERIAETLAEAGLALREKAGWNPVRRHIPAFRHMTDDERAAAIARDPLYGRVICRCETITEAEIVEAIRRGATTIDGVKRRTRAGMGRCQGGFCSPKVMGILSRELGIPLHEITKFGRASRMAVGTTR